MGEKTGFMTVLFIFGVFLIPLMLIIYIHNVEGSKLLSISTEMQQLVSAEGGVTDKVQHAVDTFSKNGVEITFKDSDGNTVIGRVPVGEEITINYKYKGFETSNSTTILKRNSD